MEINALDQLVRSEPTGNLGTRRAQETSSKHFSNLLEAHSARARVDRQTQRPAETARRSETMNSKPAYLERAEAANRADRAEANERAERRENGERSERAGRVPNERSNQYGRKTETSPAGKAAEKAAGTEQAASTDQADAGDTPWKVSFAPDGSTTEDTKAAEHADAPDAASTPVVAQTEDALAIAAPAVAASAPEQPLAALALVAVEIPEADIASTSPAEDKVAGEIDATDASDAKPAKLATALPAAAAPTASAAAADGAKPADGAKAANVAASAQIALPTSTLSEVAKQAEPTTESYSDFLLRNPLTPTVLPATDAGKEATKADTDAKEGKLIVTVSQPAAVAAPVAPVTAFAVQAAVSNDNVSLDMNAAARMPVDIEDAKAPAKPAEPTNVFAQTLESTRATQAAEEPKQVARAPIVPPHEQVAVHIRKAVADGLDQISIRLNPHELGRIDIKLDIASDGSLRAAFAADRQQTLELLKGDSRQLENALSEAGLRADAGGLNFSLRGDNRENAQAFRDMGAQFAERRKADETAEAATPAVAAGYARPRAANGRVDLNA